jgi:ribonuclease J
MNTYNKQQGHTGRANTITTDAAKLKVTFLGGLADVGEKNMAVIEYGSDALILDCGINLGINLPGINYEINDTSYLATIKHKIKGYVITHGHLDHIGGLKHTVPYFPAPIYGSRYTIGVVQKTFEDVEGLPFTCTPRLVSLDADTHESTKIGCFSVEFIRVTHSIPDPTAICITTPLGRIIATGDFRLDPEPLDNLPTDTTRLTQLGDAGVLLLMRDSSYTDVEGRVPTEHTLQKSFHDVIAGAPGRIFVAVFSSNINRTQMIINAAVAAGRKVALDGRSMLAYVEIAIRQGILKVPKGTIIPLQEAARMANKTVLILCTGGQGEPNAALMRMSQGDHRMITIKPSDTVVISSSPIPGNEISYDQIGNRLSSLGVRLYRHPTHQVDGCGPLHVSGHARRDELRDMIQLTRPKFFIPVHAGPLRRQYHSDIAVQTGMAKTSILLPENGMSVSIDSRSARITGRVPAVPVRIDQDGKVVSQAVIDQRLKVLTGDTRQHGKRSHKQPQSNAVKTALSADQIRYDDLRKRLLKPRIAQ